jgi:hypothetical protein
MSSPRRPHALNVLGAFYVEDGRCTACGVPQKFAPNLFGEDEQDHCFVKRQPQTTSERDAMLRTIATQELGCIRYRGSDEAILQRLVDAGESEQCDVAPPSHIEPKRRDHATFIAIDSTGSAPSIAASLRKYLSTLERFKCKPASSDDNVAFAALDVSWFEDRFHRVEIGPDREAGRWILRHFGPPRFSDTLHDWLTADETIADVHWQTPAQWQTGGLSQPTPW